MATFALVLAGLGVALGLPLAGLHRMEAPFERLQQHEDSERFALALQDAIAAAHAAAAQPSAALGAPSEELALALANVHELSSALEARATAQEAAACVAGARATVAELEEFLVHEALSGPIALARSDALTQQADREVHAVLACLHATNSGFRDELVALKAEVLRWSLAFAVLAPILLAAAVVHLSRSVARPLARIAEDATRIAAGDLDHRIDIDTPDEFGALAAELNAMTAALKRDRERLIVSETLAGIGRVAAGVAHELNNPLQVILGYLSLHRGVRDRQLAGHLAAVEEEALRCKEIVDSLLELSRRRVVPGLVDLRALCDDVVSALRISMRPRAVRVHVEGQAIARGERSKLRRVIFNLSKNAVEASGGGHVELAIRVLGGAVAVAVRDTGPGVSPEARARLFEPFFTTKENGTGLGLAVSRAIALAHGGDIEVANADPGAVFTLRVPGADVGPGLETPWNERACSS